MQFEWETLLEQARANHAQASANHEQARANQATAEAALLALRRNQGKWLGHDDELDAWFSDAHGVAEVATVLVQSQGGIKEEPGRHDEASVEPSVYGELKDWLDGLIQEECGRHQAHGKTSLVCTPPRAGVSKALQCEVYDIGEDGTQNCGGFGVLGRPSTKCIAGDARVWPDGIDVGIDVDAMVWALPRPPEGDNVSSGEGTATEEVNGDVAQRRLGKTRDAANAGALGEPSAAAGQSSQFGPTANGAEEKAAETKVEEVEVARPVEEEPQESAQPTAVKEEQLGLAGEPVARIVAPTAQSDECAGESQRNESLLERRERERTNGGQGGDRRPKVSRAQRRRDCKKRGGGGEEAPEGKTSGNDKALQRRRRNRGIWQGSRWFWQWRVGTGGLRDEHCKGHPTASTSTERFQTRLDQNSEAGRAGRSR